MARTIDAGTLAALQAGRISRVDMITIDLPSGIYGFFSGSGTFTHNSVTYRGAGSLFEIDGVGGVSDGTAVPLRVRLNAAADFGLTANVLATIEQEQYRGRPISYSVGFFSADTWALLSVEMVWRGVIDTIEHVEQVGGEAWLEAMCESRAIDLGRSGWRRRSDADQRRIDANDGSLRHLVAAAQGDLYWGRLPPAKTA
jgi:hypothetical protein